MVLILSRALIAIKRTYGKLSKVFHLQHTTTKYGNKKMMAVVEMMIVGDGTPVLLPFPGILFPNKIMNFEDVRKTLHALPKNRTIQ
jgi:hypothetical protein